MDVVVEGEVEVAVEEVEEVMVVGISQVVVIGEVQETWVVVCMVVIIKEACMDLEVMVKTMLLPSTTMVIMEEDMVVGMIRWVMVNLVLMVVQAVLVVEGQEEVVVVDTVHINVVSILACGKGISIDIGICFGFQASKYCNHAFLDMFRFILPLQVAGMCCKYICQN